MKMVKTFSHTKKQPNVLLSVVDALSIKSTSKWSANQFTLVSLEAHFDVPYLIGRSLERTVVLQLLKAKLVA